MFENNELGTYLDKAIDTVCHSTSMYEMKVKADLLNVDLLNVDVLIQLCMMTASHHAYWQHTKKHFTAFKNLLRYDESIEKASRSKKFKLIVEEELAYLKDMQKKYFSPGLNQEIRNLKQVLDIVLKPIKQKKQMLANDKIVKRISLQLI